MEFSKRVVWTLSWTVALGALADCTPPVKKETVTIGGVLPATGAAPAPSWTTAAQLALSDANAGLVKAGTTVSGGSLLQLSYVAGDSAGSTLPTAQSAVALVQGGAKAIITDLSGADEAVNSLNYVTATTTAGTGTIVTADKVLGVPVVCVQCTSPSIGATPAATSSDPPTQAALTDADGWNFRTVMNQTNEINILMRIVTSKHPSAPGQPFKFTFVAATNSSGISTPGSLRTALANPSLGLTQTPILNTVFVPFDIYDSPTSAFHNGDGWATIASMAASANTYTYSNAFASPSKWAQDCWDGCPGYDATAANPGKSCTEACGAATVLNDFIPTPDDNPAVDVLPNVVGENGLTTSEVALATAWVKSGTTIPLVHLHGFRNPALVANLQAGINGQEGVSSLLVTSDASGTTFTNEVKAGGSNPQYTDAITYDAAMTLSLATALASVKMAHPGSVTGAEIRDAMKLINDHSATATQIGVGPAEFEKAVKVFQKGGTINYNGASGPCDFDARGNVNQLLVHYIGKDGAFVDEEKYDCITDPVNCPILP